jgi:MFS family permease
MGPLLGGVLTDGPGWQWIFFLNVPIAAFAVLVTWLRVHQPQPEVEDHRIDYPGIATLSTGLLLVLLAFDQAADWGFADPRVIGMLVVAVGLIVASP